jgi:hypothetical protein
MDAPADVLAASPPPLEEFRRDGLLVLRGLLAPARAARLREVADGLRARYLARDPLTGRRGFLESPWHVQHVNHPGFYAGAPDSWHPETLELLADARILDTWRAAVGTEPVFVNASLFIDPPLPYAVDAAMQKLAAPDGAGLWHRDVPGEPDDEKEKAALLGGAARRGSSYLLEIAVVASDAFEYVTGSHLRWDTPAELAARKRGTTIAERSAPLPGSIRPLLEPGDAILVDGRGVHRGWYAHGVERRTITLSYVGEEYPRLFAEGDERLRCFVQPDDLERLTSAARRFYARWPAASAGRPQGD